MGKQIEIERKYIIKMPDLSQIRMENGYTESRIVQIYLNSAEGETHRIRKRSSDHGTVYTETVKRRIDAISSHEEENEISEEKFQLLSKSIRSGTRPIIKTRYTFFWDEITYEIDVYPDWTASAVMETELESREARAKIPEFIEIIKEVTGDFRYSNASMAHSFPKEEI